MNSESREFSARLLVFLSVAFAIHMLVNKLMSIPLFQHQILVSYAINTALAAGIFWGLTSLKKKYNNQIGFLYLASSIVKFSVFFFSILRALQSRWGNCLIRIYFVFYSLYNLSCSRNIFSQ